MTKPSLDASHGLGFGGVTFLFLELVICHMEAILYVRLPKLCLYVVGCTLFQVCYTMITHMTYKC